MSEVKNRKKSGSKGAPADPGKRSEGGKSPEARGGGGGGPVDPRTGVSLLSLGMCLGLAWFVFQQSEKFAKVENQYQLLKKETNEFQQLQSKISLISEKLESTERILQEAASSMALVTQFEQEVSSLQRITRAIQHSEEMLTHKMQSLNDTFRNVTNVWQRSLEDMNARTDLLKSESKHMHSQVTVQINSAEQGVRWLTERLRDLEDSTLRNIRTVRAQEEEDLRRLEEQLRAEAGAVAALREEQRALGAGGAHLAQRLASCGPRAAACAAHLPAIQGTLRAVLRVSRDLLGTERRVEALTLQVFNAEEDMLRAVAELMEMRETLEGLRYDNSILKMQNELRALKGKVHDFVAYSSAREKGALKERAPEKKGIDSDF